MQRLEDASGRAIANPYNGQPTVSQALLDTGAAVELSYMGSAEFETAATARSAAKIWDIALELRIVTQQLVRPTYTESVHFICSEEQRTNVLPRWHAFIEAPLTKEHMGYLHDDERDGTDVVDPKPIGWWAIDENLIWTRDRAIAERILGSFTASHVIE